MRAPTCRCGSRAELRQREAFGRVRVVWQCTRDACGKVLSAAPVLGHDVDPRDLPRSQRRRRREPNSRKREYKAFLSSPAWKRIRGRVLQRSKGLCEMKLWGCTGRATQVHHVDYEGGLEGLDEQQNVDLRKFKASCRGCNLLERERRITSHVLGSSVAAVRVVVAEIEGRP